MYKSNNIRYQQYVNFGVAANIGASMLPNDPGKVIDIFKTLGKVKNKLSKPVENTTRAQKLESLAGDVGAVGGVLTSAVGAGMNKYTKGITRGLGDKLKRYGVDTVTDDARRLNLGNNILASGAVAGTGLVGGLGIAGIGKAYDMLNPSMQIDSENISDEEFEMDDEIRAYRSPRRLYGVRGV